MKLILKKRSRHATLSRQVTGLRAQLAKGDQILAVPTVVRKLPKPVRILIGNLANTDCALVGLDLRADG